MGQSLGNNRTWRGRLWRYAPLILWIGVIFFLSSSAGSMSRTSIIVRPILMFLFPNAPEETLILYHGYVRKCAHFTEYAILTLWAVRAFAKSAIPFLRRWFLATSCLIVAVSAADEFNQSFNSLRTGQFADVLLDLSGGLFGLLMVFAIKRYFANVNPTDLTV